jgi:5,6-dimethylbenzimidazole synthase
MKISARKIMITGGCRSGKSRYALERAKSISGARRFVATAKALDDEMRQRIDQHRKERGKDWQTIEEPLELARILQQVGKEPGPVIVDCLTLWLNNWLMQEDSSKNIILEQIDQVLASIADREATFIFITNEVGDGIVPENKLAREFRDLAGEINQQVAAFCDEVLVMVSGIPVRIKPGPESSEPRKNEAANPHEFPSEKKQGLYDAIYQRRDVRHFKPDPIAPYLLGKMLHAAHHAGSVGFMQPWNFIVIDDPAIKDKVFKNFVDANNKASQKYQDEREKLYASLKLEGIKDAPINICITCDGNRMGPDVLGRDSIPETDLFSTCCAVQNLWLSARAEGVGVGWVSILSVEQLKADLNIPESVFPVAYLCLGYTEQFHEKPLLEKAGWANRLQLSDLVYFNQWEKGFPGISVSFPEEIN